MKYSELTENGTIMERELDEAVANQLRPLAYDPGAYFDINEMTLLVPLELLISTRARPDGILNACGLMEKAARGEISKRAPISISAYSNKKFLVNDGNSTVMNARFSGWPTIPCVEL